MYAYNRDLAALELCYADLCRELARHESVTCLVPDDSHAEKIVVLSGLPREQFPIASIPDIWIRDFAPIPVHGGFVGFRYAPRYTSRKLNQATEGAARRLLPEASPATRIEVVLEG